MARVGLQLSVVAGLLTLLLALPARPAAADPAVPTHYVATITEVVAADGAAVPVTLEVVGGDAFLVLRAAPGVTVAVPGYEGEPYLRWHADGRVEVNDRSPSRWLNDARYGAAEVTVPATADAAADPVWRTVADAGVYAWHDHRIHVMSPVLPPSVDPSRREQQPVLDLEVPLIVDDRDVVVHGSVVWRPGPPWSVVALLLLGGVGLPAAVLRRWSGARDLLLAGTVTAAAAVGAGSVLGRVPGVDVDPALLVLPALALVLVAVGRWAAVAGRPGGPHLAAGAVVPLTVWSVLLLGALTRPVVPGLLPVAVVRPVVALTLGVALAAAVVTVREAGWLRLPDDPSG